MLLVRLKSLILSTPCTRRTMPSLTFLPPTPPPRPIRQTHVRRCRRRVKAQAPSASNGHTGAFHLNTPSAVAHVSQSENGGFSFDGLSPPLDFLEWRAKETEHVNGSNNVSHHPSSNESSHAHHPLGFVDSAVKEPRVDAAFVNTFRTSSPYIHAYHGLTFVIHIPGALLDEEMFEPVMQDIALMRAIGIKPVLVLGPKAQIERRLCAEQIESEFVAGVRVTDNRTLQIIKEVSGSMRFEVEGVLARGVVNMPSSSRVSVVSGSFYSAQPLGILNGTDFGFTGKVRRIDAEGIHRRLDQGDIIVLPNVGFSPSGQLFNCQSEAVAGACAAQLRAEKLIFLAAEDIICDTRSGRGIPYLTFEVADQFLEQHASSLPDDFRLAVGESVGALRNGVRRTHILNRFVNGVLLMEVFHRDGVGLMISRDIYEGIRPARVRDVPGMVEIIKPLVQSGILRHRERATIEHEIGDYVVVERDGMIIACLSLRIVEDNPRWAELGCFAVHVAYRKLGKGDAMMSFIERIAFSKGVENLFILSTQSYHFFMDRGFVEISVADLPMSRQAYYDVERKPKIFRRVLKETQPRFDDALRFHQATAG